jgi:hypothetical protein
MTVHSRHAVAAAAAAVIFTAGVAAAQDAGVRPVASVRQIMEALVVPASDAVFNVADPPADATAWAGIERQAAMLAEGGNLLLLGSRARDGQEWAESARALVDGAAKAATAAHDQNFDALVEASDAVYGTCVSCHATYLPKP